MFEESMSPTASIWASMNSWFTPAVFFVVVNLMIGTIAITSRLGNQRHQGAGAEAEAEASQEYPQHRPLARSPSVLQRLKSINFYPYRSQEPANTFEKSPESESHFDFKFKQLHEREQPQLPRSTSLLQRLKSINLRSYQSPEPSAPESPDTAITATATSDLHKTREFDIHYTTLQQPLENEEEEQSQEDNEDEDEDEEQDQYPDQTMNEVYGRLQGTHATKPSTPQSPTTAVTANATSDLLKNHEFDSHFTTLQQPLENEEEEEQFQQEDEYKEQDQYADQTMNEIYDRLQVTHATKPASAEVPRKPKRKMKKSVSAKLAASPHVEEYDMVEARRPATVREGKVVATEDNEEVDSKADNFINNFKNQLKLQRMESISRNNEDDRRRLSGN